MPFPAAGSTQFVNARFRAERLRFLKTALPRKKDEPSQQQDYSDFNDRLYRSPHPGPGVKGSRPVERLWQFSHYFFARLTVCPAIRAYSIVFSEQRLASLAFPDSVIRSIRAFDYKIHLRHPAYPSTAFPGNNRVRSEFLN
jgi:hypothetical protein